jgi:uncharacterized protein YlxW (UPF0749 family)
MNNDEKCLFVTQQALIEELERRKDKKYQEEKRQLEEKLNTLYNKIIAEEFKNILEFSI